MKKITNILKNTTQRMPLLGASQIKNHNGGYVFSIDKWKVLERFLILGTESGTYYVKSKPLTSQGISNTIDCIRENGLKTVEMIREISIEGRGIKNDYAIFALAACMKYGDDATRQEAYSAVNQVCRIGTHLFQLAEAITALGKGWSRGTKRAFANWYLGKRPEKLALQLAKYQQREGWSNRDLLRLAHPKTSESQYQAMFAWATKGTISEDLPEFIQGFEKAKAATSVSEIVGLISKYNLPRECIPTNFLNEVEVWKALLPEMPITALVRNLGAMTAKNVLQPLSAEAKLVCSKLENAEAISKSKIHPVAILVAMKQYATGKGLKGSNTWTPNQNIIASLEKAMMLSFDNVEASNKNFLIGVDISPSMQGSWLCGNVLSTSEAAAAIALVTAKTEPNSYVVGFTDQLRTMKIHSGSTFAEAVKEAKNSAGWGGTDCAKPMEYALKNKLDVDVFITITDNETHSGTQHVTQALTAYRKGMNKPNAKHIVLACTVTDFSIADPKDPNQMDIPGFDPSIPSVITSFAKL